MNRIIAGKNLDKWISKYPVLKDIINYKEIIWINPEADSNFNRKQKKLNEKILEAESRLQRFAPYIKEVFPDTENGLIESSLIKTDKMKEFLEKYFSLNINGDIYLKCDYNLPVAGSIKARGGIYAVLKHAEELALKQNIININENYLKLKDFKKFFSQYSIAVGSTGNLGLSIGIMGSKLGFKVTVHMSANAKEWKKKLLHSRDVNVIEYKSDYSRAVEEGRKESAEKSNSYFIDDENSVDLFTGYAVAAKMLKKQLEKKNIKINKGNQLFVYLPCGVGGGPGGITYGLKNIFGKYVHCFFVEPTHAPSMLLGLLTGKNNKICVQDFGIDNITEADGLAVGKPSGFIGKEFGNLIDGILTVSDKKLYIFLYALKKYEDIFMEPSAQAGFIGPLNFYSYKKCRDYMYKNNIEDVTHLVWGTGGSLVPEKESIKYFNKSIKYI